MVDVASWDQAPHIFTYKVMNINFIQHDDYSRAGSGLFKAVTREDRISVTKRVSKKNQYIRTLVTSSEGLNIYQGNINITKLGVYLDVNMR